MGPRRDNLKAIEARERKAQQSQLKKEAEIKAKEDAKWRDEGTKVQRQKEARKAEADQKADEARRRREERLALEKSEQQSLIGSQKGVGNKGSQNKKVTQYQILQKQLLMKKESELRQVSSGMSRVISAEDADLLTPNINHLRREEAYDAMLAGDTVIHATGIEEALIQLESASESQKVDLHPERRARVAYRAFEEREMERMKIEIPGLKRSQYIERIQKLWQKSPENPLAKE